MRECDWCTNSATHVVKYCGQHAPGNISDERDALAARVKLLEELNETLTKATAGLDRTKDLLMDGYKARIADLEAALRDIAVPGYGIEMHDTDNDRAEYWSTVALRLRTIARAALEMK